MLAHIKDYTSYNFFTLHCMLWNRKDTRLSKLGYGPIYIILNFIKYTDTIELVKNYYVDAIKKMKVYEERLEISEKAITGIKLTYVNDPINSLRLSYRPEFLIGGPYTNFLYSPINGPVRWPFGGVRPPCNNNKPCCNALFLGHLECLIFLQEKGFHFDDNIVHAIFTYLVSHGHFECLKYFHNRHRNYQFSSNIFDSALNHGHMKCINYLLENGCINTYFQRNMSRRRQQRGR